MQIDCEYIIKVNLEIITSDDLPKEEIENKIKEEGKKKLRYLLSGYMTDPDNKIFTEEIKLKNTKYASI